MLLKTHDLLFETYMFPKETVAFPMAKACYIKSYFPLLRVVLLDVRKRKSVGQIQHMPLTEILLDIVVVNLQCIGALRHVILN